MVNINLSKVINGDEDTKIRGLFLILFVFILVLILLPVNIKDSNNQNSQNILYLLSTIPQALGFIFAVVMAFAGFVIELSNKPNSRISKESAFQFTTILYICSIVINILLPMLLLGLWSPAAYWFELLVRSCLSLTTINLMGVSILLIRACQVLKIKTLKFEDILTISL